MKIRTLLILLCLFFAISSAMADKQGKTKAYSILFIGNSLSYWNEIPQILELIGSQSDRKIKTDCLCKANYALMDHWDEGKVEKQLSENKYDYILLQQGPSSQPLGRKLLLEYGEKFVSLATKYGSQAVFYMVWPAETHYQHMPGVIDSYSKAAEDTQALLAPVGKVWDVLKESEIAWSLYSSDRFHPSKQGAFVAAWVIYQSLFSNQPVSYSAAFSPYLDIEEYEMLVLVSSKVIRLSDHSPQELFAMANSSYEKGDYPSFLDYMIRLDQVRPDNITVLYHLAMAYALNDQITKTERTLQYALRIDSSLPYQREGAFEGILSPGQLSALSDSAAQLNNTIETGQNSFQSTDSGLHPEGIAYDSHRDVFLITSVRRGHILQVAKDGTESVFCQPDRRQSLLGIQVDADNGVVWSTAVSTGKLDGVEEEYPSALLKIDLKSGTVMRRYETGSKEDWLGDLTLHPNGTVFVSNSSAHHPTIYQLDVVQDTLLPIFQSAELTSIQGLAMAPSRQILYFSDYRYGLHAFDLRKRTMVKLINETSHPLKGIDGLYYHSNTLIAIHNGIKPYRVVQYDLDSSGKRIAAFQYLEKALPEMGEPTLGVICGNEMYYVVNSPWTAYSETGEFIQEKASKPVIRKILLE